MASMEKEKQRVEARARQLQAELEALRQEVQTSGGAAKQWAAEQIRAHQRLQEAGKEDSEDVVAMLIKLSGGDASHFDVDRASHAGSVSSGIKRPCE